MNEEPPPPPWTPPQTPWPARLKAWWNLPRLIGLAAALLGLAHYLPLPALPRPRLLRLHADVAPELIGIGITLILIDWAVARRQREELKAQLIRHMGSAIRDVAVPAARELAHHGWLYDGSLKWAILLEADLSGAQLEGANLSGASLYRANLSGADLLDAELNGTTLVNANLNEAYLPRAVMRRASLQGVTLANATLSGADLSGAALAHATLELCHLRDANLSGVDLERADLQLADLRSAHLTGARNWTIEQLGQTLSLAGAIMPDGVRLGWASGDGKQAGDPTFEEWAAHYLAQHGGALDTLRDSSP